MRPLFTAALAIYVAVIAPASAETVFVEGVWNGNRLEFRDPMLNGDADYFASLEYDHAGFSSGRVYTLQTNIPLYNQFVYQSDTDWVRYFFDNWSELQFDDGYHEFYQLWYGLEEFREGVLIQYESITITEWWHSYYVWRADDDHYSTNDPALVNSQVSSIFSALPLQGVGIFDFTQSFIHYSNGSSISLANLMFSRLDGANWNYIYHYGDLIVDTRNNDFTLVWSDYDDSVTGVTLAYNLPIPEPETWAMLLAGLGIVGAVTRRRSVYKSSNVNTTGERNNNVPYFTQYGT